LSLKRIQTASRLYPLSAKSYDGRLTSPDRYPISSGNRSATSLLLHFARPRTIIQACGRPSPKSPGSTPQGLRHDRDRDAHGATLRSRTDYIKHVQDQEANNPPTQDAENGRNTHGSSSEGFIDLSLKRIQIASRLYPFLARPVDGRLTPCWHASDRTPVEVMLS